MAVPQHFFLPVGIDGIVNHFLGEDRSPFPVVCHIAVRILVVIVQILFLVKDIDKIHVFF